MDKRISLEKWNRRCKAKQLLIPVTHRQKIRDRRSLALKVYVQEVQRNVSEAGSGGWNLCRGGLNREDLKHLPKFKDAQPKEFFQGWRAWDNRYDKWLWVQSRISVDYLNSL